MATRFDQCHGCGRSATPNRTTFWTVQLTCSGGHRRQASDRETDEWLKVLDLQCPECGGPVVVERGYGLRLVCETPNCEGSLKIEAVSAAVEGGSHRPRDW